MGEFIWRWEWMSTEVLSHNPPKRGAELGVKEGKFSAYLLERFRSLHMVCVDLWAEKPAIERVGYETYSEWDFGKIKREFDSRISPYNGRATVLQMSTVDAAAHVPDESLDFIFIDAEHTYEGVIGDIDAWSPKVRKGGIIAGHDYYNGRFPGVVRAVDERFEKIKRGTDTVWYTTK